MRDQKRGVRASVRAALAALPPARRALEEELVGATMQQDPIWQKARTVLLYRSVAPEFSTVGLILAAWRAGKATAFPRVDGVALELLQAQSWQGFQEGYRGIPEPREGRVVQPEEVDLAVVPGVAWTAVGDRLGRGGGHYDRLIPRLRCPVWGLAFDAQVFPELPREAHDHAVHRVWHAGA